MDRLVQYILPIITILIICRAFPSLEFFYFPVAILVIVIFILYIVSRFYLLKDFIIEKDDLSKRANFIIVLLIFFGIWAVITTVWSTFPLISFKRAVYFLFISISPLIIGYYWSRNNRNDLFGYLLPANIFVVLTCLISLVASIPSDAWSGGHGLGFMGFTWHQNMLATAIVFTIPSVLYPLLQFIVLHFKNNSSVGHVNIWAFLFYLVLLSLNIYFLVASVSRAGVIVLIIMIFIFFILSLRIKFSVIFVVMFISISAIIFYSSDPVREFVFKTEQTIGDRRIINIRETINAAKNGGLFGIGYGISQPPSHNRVRGHYELDGKMFIREKMISILALLEEVGIIGLCLFITPLIIIFSFLIRKFIVLTKRNDSSNLKTIHESMQISALLAIFIGYSFHAQIEGWWLGIGSVFFPLFFIICGQSIMIGEQRSEK